MTTLDLAKKYLHVFFESQDFDSLYDLFSENLDFKGPLFQCDSAREYIESLKAGIWESCSCEILEEYENSKSAACVYVFTKGQEKTLMSQVFYASEGKIYKVRLIFNAVELQ